MIQKKSRKIIEQLFLMFCLLKKKNYILPMHQNISRIVKNVSLLMIPNGEGWNYITVKKLLALLKGIT